MVSLLLVPGSESYTRELRNLAHLRASDGTWLLAPALAHMRMSAAHYCVRLRRFLRLTLPVCNYADGTGSTRLPRSASNVANPTHDLYGDFTLSDFRAVGQAQWLELHEEIKHFFLRAAKQAGITSVSTEKRADLATSMRRPGDIKIGSTRHGWKAASGRRCSSTSPPSARSARRGWPPAPTPQAPAARERLQRRRGSC